ncbi:hypothetical protein [Proteiniborus sp.]|uniref:hypothetical protein n=1 Tax=Proteiniborus sp. TaxID=2079015 RepID=UPI00331DCD47
MSIPKKRILELVEGLTEEKLGKVISFIKFIKEEEEPVLLLEPEDEKEIIKVLEEDDWYSSDEVKKMIEDKEND